MSKIKLSIIALSCVMALSACSSSSKGGTDNSEQIRQLENDLNQKIAELSKKTESKNSKSSNEGSQNQSNKSQVSQTGTKGSYTYTSSSDTETKLKELEKLLADEKSKVSLGDKIFGGTSGEMTDYISGGILVGEKNEASRPQARDIRDLTITDENGRLVDINILRRAGEMDPESFEPYDDQYNLRKERQTILSNSNFKSSAFGAYYDTLTGNRYFFAQGLPTAVAQIPTSGQVEYKGGAVYKKDGEQNYSELSEMTATADFATKVIDINIAGKTNALPGMNFGGKISGNSFAGNANGIKTQGGFFGENAQEMTGLFINEADQARGAFGGIKQ
ncbi:MAG: transferrin-binding protein-like solute binding protein [Haemophilus parainfluenzae]|jgi:raw score 8.23|uniref:Transferrin-binding protein-like solute binding protein n=1 Tax=Haemophilus parainfluenzae TaxID=729 RepID=A0A7M1NY98_HAEPA|nr:transferrin-binding protein-like solute binding protein [Haemophilus parainfluenzae]MBS6669800.1 transferrin-binding protein-like solute binding protein [Haemophilus parainfluenzae]QOR17449.1 transferrin-binding protein-like solute binding protein [Haemophilus parainfluenzae]